MKKNEIQCIDGILLLNKPKGYSSNQILQKVKRLFKAKKAGHTGALDPLATGMLPICFGEATKFSQFLLDADKVYETTARLGEATTTGDCEGEIIDSQTIPELNLKFLKGILTKFEGASLQTPPMYSALKHQGQPLYKLARKGIEITRDARKIYIKKIELKGFSNNEINIKVHCTKGTYIRTLVEDIAKAMGTIAHVKVLHRLSVAPFHHHPMHDFTQLQPNLSKLLPIDAALTNVPELLLSAQQSEKIIHGQLLKDFFTPDNMPSDHLIFRLYNMEYSNFMGLGERIDSVNLKARRLTQNKCRLG